MQPVSDLKALYQQLEELQGFAVNKHRKIQKPESKITSKNQRIGTRATIDINQHFTKQYLFL